MTTKNRESKKFRWFDKLLDFLLASNLTRAQKGNYVFDGLAVISYISLLFTNTESYYKVICFLALIFAGMWCHAISMPAGKKR